MAVGKILSVEGIADPYLSKILLFVIGKNPLKVLSRTPQRLRNLTRGVGKKTLRRAPAEGKWSIREIVSHMTDAEVVFAFRVRMAIAQSGNALHSMDEQRWAAELHYRDRSVKESIESFRALRENTLSLLQKLSDEELQRFGIHEERGKETVERMAQLYAGHDLNHLEQIGRILSGKKGRRKKKQR